MDGPSNTTVFAYDASGKLVAEYSTEQASSPTVNYTATDPLGSPRVITNKQGEVVSRRDFMPFGEEIAPDAAYRTAALKYGISDGVRQKFTGYQRDEETDLDFAEARYYYNDHGRFTAVDPLLASGKSANPQTFNRYAYTMNRPLILTDAKGLQSGKKAALEGIVRTIVSGRWDMAHPDAADFSFDKKSVDRIVKAIMPAVEKQYQLSFTAQNALNAQANSRSNVTTSSSVTKTTAPTTVTLKAGAIGEAKGQIGTQGLGVTGTVNGGGEITTTIAPGTSSTSTTTRSPANPQQLDQMASENIGAANQGLSTTVENISGLSGTQQYQISIEGTSVTQIVPKTNVAIQNFAGTAREILKAADEAGRQKANEVNPVAEP